MDSSFLRNYAETRGFMLGRPVKAKPSPDGKSVLFLRAMAKVASQSLFIFDLDTGKTRELLTPEQVLKGAEEHLSPEEKARRERQRISVGGFTDFQISNDSAQILLSLSGKLYVVKRDSGEIKQLNTGDADVIDPKFSPDSKKVSFVQDYDLKIIDLASGKIQSVTEGGSAELSHGLAEFVAQEELDRFSGYWWSPDSQSIVYEEVDAAGVEVWYLADPQHPANKPVPSFYPRPGKANVKARLFIIALKGGKAIPVDWDSESYPYLATVGWTENAPLTISVLTRDQKNLKLLTIDHINGKTKAILSENDSAWINVRKNLPCWLSDGSAFLWVSERNGAEELELHDKNGALIRTISGKEEGFRSLVDADQQNNTVYYIASSDPRQAHLYSRSIGSSSSSSKNPNEKAVKLTEGEGVHGAEFARDHSIYVHEASLLASMPEFAVCNLNGQNNTGILDSVAENPALLCNLELVQTGGEQNFNCSIIRPQSFDRQLRYPVLVDVYGGPHKIKVVASKRNYLLDQWLADQGFIVVSIDGRGTPGRGRAWERAIAQRFGSLPLDDQIEALKELGKKFPEMDLERVGITGWSFGGYMSGLAVLRRPDIFKAAVAGAPVVDWLDYDSCYTERYLGLPDKFPEAYKEASLLSYAKDLKRPLLLVHGTSDDNVFFRHSLKLADALFRSGKEFGILPLSGLTHMVPDPVVMEQLWSRIILHFHQHLGKPEKLQSD